MKINTQASQPFMQMQSQQGLNELLETSKHLDIQIQRAKSVARKSKKTNVNLLNVMNRNKAKVSRKRHDSISRRLTSLKDKALNFSEHQKLMEAKLGLV